MSEYYFGLFDGAVSDGWREAADAIATGHDARVCLYDDPAGGPRGWFAGPNLGAPFDSAMSAAVLGELEAAGLWDGGPVESDVVDGGRESEATGAVESRAMRIARDGTAVVCNPFAEPGEYGEHGRIVVVTGIPSGVSVSSVAGVANAARAAGFDFAGVGDRIGWIHLAWAAASMAARDGAEAQSVDDEAALRRAMRDRLSEAEMHLSARGENAAMEDIQSRAIAMIERGGYGTVRTDVARYLLALADWCGCIEDGGGDRMLLHGERIDGADPIGARARPCPNCPRGWLILQADRSLQCDGCGREWEAAQ